MISLTATIELVRRRWTMKSRVLEGQEKFAHI